jgi:hypothetical protein
LHRDTEVSSGRIRSRGAHAVARGYTAGFKIAATTDEAAASALDALKEGRPAERETRTVGCAVDVDRSSYP